MVFTINAIDNNYFQNGQPAGELERICFNSWTKYFNVKVFDYNSPEIKECKEKYKNYLDLCLKKKSLSCYADVLRMYILSLYPSSVYFDTDFYLINPERLNFKYTEWQSSGGFQLMYNGYATDIAKQALNIYKTVQKVIRDKGIVKELQLTQKRLLFPQSIGIHLSTLSDESPHFNCICNDVTKIPDFVERFLELPDKKLVSRLYFFTNIAHEFYIDNYFKSKRFSNNRELLVLKDLSKLLSDDRLKIIDLVKQNKKYLGEA